jgi:hypothetical protein
MFNNFFFENRNVYKKMWKNIIEPGRPHITIGRMRRYVSLQTHTPEHWVSIATAVARTSLNIALYVHCLSSLLKPFIIYAHCFRKPTRTLEMAQLLQVPHLDSWIEHLVVSLWNDQQMRQGTSGFYQRVPNFALWAAGIKLLNICTGLL